MKLKQLQQLLRKNWVLVLIFLVATWFRTWNLPAGLIFFDDAAADMMVAWESLQARELPLLGIASSVPRFHQGPITVWWEMLLQLLFGPNLMMIGLAFVLVALVSLVLVYEFCDRYLHPRISMIATWLMALSPLAIAQARMPYHTNPIPLATILYLLMLMRLWQKKAGGLFWSTLAWAFLFQFELAVFPTLLVIPWVLYRTGQWQFSWIKVRAVIGGLTIGLLPQILYDLTHQFSQLGLFVVWVGYRLISGFGGEHRFSIDKLTQTIDSFWLYGGRIFSTDRPPLTILFFLLIMGAVILLIQQARQRKIQPAMEVILAFTVVLTLGYVVHGSPSEAYFPPYIVVWPILVAFLLDRLFTKRSAFLLGFLLAWGMVNARSIVAHRFFVSNPQSFSYGCAVSDQMKIIDFIGSKSEGDFRLDTLRDIRQFPSTFANLRWWGRYQGYSENQTSNRYFYLENQASPLVVDPTLKVKRFGCLDVYFYEQPN